MCRSESGEKTHTPRTGFPSRAGWLAGRTHIHTYIRHSSFSRVKTRKRGFEGYRITMMHGKSSSFAFTFTSAYKLLSWGIRYTTDGAVRCTHAEPMLVSFVILSTLCSAYLLIYL
ncbi:hypothetical protein QBC32DRAFT_8758 [Pseudoneurospora amorphoporcata]|uniref:Uncharacterized protein n=1 Tax=Pseudoneurospora amorphoporcata TaxID=241081 RepID=A0AAN6NT73_9PEZI|nr:hypothetical protein QBC32DRAFT_8758 [Pseudoneurospora amorphoporcata]